MLITKRDGQKQNFQINKTINSILKAANSIKVELTSEQIESLKNKILELTNNVSEIEVEKYQEIIEKALYLCGFRKIKNSYKEYRKERTNIRQKKLNISKTIEQIGITTDRDNANVGNNFSSKLLRIASESNKWVQLNNMPKEIAKEHEQLDLYYHDLDSFNLSTNCLHIPTKDILMNGFNTGYGTINTPKRIETAAELSCILLQSTQNDMFGGQSHPDFDNDLSIFVEPTRQEIRNELKELEISEDKIEDLVEKKLKNRIHQAMQGVVYNLNTMHSRAGSLRAV